MRHTARRTTRAALTTGHALAAAARGVSLLHHQLTTARRVQIAYRKENGETSVRIIEPETVKRSKAGDLYVRAHDLLRDANRTFRLDRITALETA